MRKASKKYFIFGSLIAKRACPVQMPWPAPMRCGYQLVCDLNNGLECHPSKSTVTADRPNTGLQSCRVLFWPRPCVGLGNARRISRKVVIRIRRSRQFDRIAKLLRLGTAIVRTHIIDSGHVSSPKPPAETVPTSPDHVMLGSSPRS